MKDSYEAFFVNGFSNWKKALDRFSTHERSELHKAAVLALSAQFLKASSRLSQRPKAERNE